MEGEVGMDTDVGYRQGAVQEGVVSIREWKRPAALFSAWFGSFWVSIVVDVRL